MLTPEFVSLPWRRALFAPARLLVCVCVCCCVSRVSCLSIYRCEALDDVVSYTRPGQDTPDEFVRIDIRGKAFVYVSVWGGRASDVQQHYL